MRKGSFQSNSSQPYDNSEHHYEYYYPLEMRGGSREGRNKRSLSFKQKSYTDFEGFVTPRERTVEKKRNSGDELASKTEVKKMRISDLWKIREQGEQGEQGELSEVKAKSMLSEEV